MVKWYKYRNVGKGTIPGISTYDIPNAKGTGWTKMKSKVTKGGVEYISINPKSLEKRKNFYK